MKEVQRRSRFESGGTEKIIKPKVVDECNKYIGGVDQTDQLVLYYGYSHWQVKWWRHGGKMQTTEPSICSLPILKRVIDGIRRHRAAGGKPPRARLPITVTVLRRIQSPLDTASNPDSMAYWAIATSAFFRFFRLEELLVEKEASYSPALHLI